MRYAQLDRFHSRSIPLYPPLFPLSNPRHPPYPPAKLNTLIRINGWPAASGTFLKGLFPSCEPEWTRTHRVRSHQLTRPPPSTVPGHAGIASAGQRILDLTVPFPEPRLSRYLQGLRKIVFNAGGYGDRYLRRDRREKRVIRMGVTANTWTLSSKTRFRESRATLRSQFPPESIPGRLAIILNYR